jgi:hypothetical protein
VEELPSLALLAQQVPALVQVLLQAQIWMMRAQVQAEGLVQV